MDIVLLGMGINGLPSVQEETISRIHMMGLHGQVVVIIFLILVLTMGLKGVLPGLLD